VSEPGPAPLTLAESGRRFGHACWLERRLFEMCGAWSADTVEPAARPFLAAHAAHHAWHAEVIGTRLPRASGFDGDSLVAPPTEAFAAFIDEVAGIAPDRTVERLVALYGVLVPHLVASYDAHRDGLTRISDGPGRRWMRLILADERHDLADGERLLERVLAGASDGDRASVHRADLEQRKMRALSNPESGR
jgi:hypothetical protein